MTRRELEEKYSRTLIARLSDEDIAALPTGLNHPSLTVHLAKVITGNERTRKAENAARIEASYAKMGVSPYGSKIGRQRRLNR